MGCPGKISPVSSSAKKLTIEIKVAKNSKFYSFPKKITVKIINSTLKCRSENWWDDETREGGEESRKTEELKEREQKFIAGTRFTRFLRVGSHDFFTNRGYI